MSTVQIKKERVIKACNDNIKWATDQDIKRKAKVIAENKRRWFGLVRDRTDDEAIQYILSCESWVRWDYLHSSQSSLVQRILEAATKSDVDLITLSEKDVNEIAFL